MAGTPSAHADNAQDVVFLALLEEHGIQGNVLGIPWAHRVCDNTDAWQASGYPLGSALVTEVNRVYAETDRYFTRDSAEWFVAISVVTYCPWNNPSSGGSGTDGPGTGTLA